MRSFRFYSILIFCITLSVLLTALFFSQSVVKPVFHKTYAFREYMLAYEVTLGESHLPLAVLGNISDQFSNQTVTHEQMDTAKVVRLRTVFQSNKIKLINQLDSVSSQIAKLDTIVADAGNYPIVKRYQEYYLVEKQVKALSVLITQAKEELRQIQFDSISSDSTHISKLNDTINQLASLTRNLLDHMAVWSRQLIDAYMKSVGITYVFLAVAGLVLALFLARILRMNRLFIAESFKKLSRFETLESVAHNFKPIFKEESIIHDTVKSIFDEQRFLNDIKDISNQCYLLDDFLDELFHKVQEVMPVDRLGIAFISDDRSKVFAEYGICSYEDTLLKSGYEISLNDTSLKRVFEDQCSYFDNDLLKTYSNNSMSPSLSLIVKEGIRSNMIIPLINNESVFGVLFFSSRKVNAFNDIMLQIGKNISHELSTVIHKTYLTKKMLTMVTETFARLVESRDHETGDHIGRMTTYAVWIAEALVDYPIESYRVLPSFVRDIQGDAPIHDIGKVSIPDEILKKPSKLTQSEFEVMKTHSVVGSQILESMREKLQFFEADFFKNANDIVKYHHEKWDGTGYPDGLKGESIPLAARIVAVADVFDALMSKRVYKDEYSLRESIKILEESAGSHLDPLLVKIFLAKLNENMDSIFDKET